MNIECIHRSTLYILGLLISCMDAFMSFWFHSLAYELCHLSVHSHTWMINDYLQTTAWNVQHTGCKYWYIYVSKKIVGFLFIRFQVCFTKFHNVWWYYSLHLCQGLGCWIIRLIYTLHGNWGGSCMAVLVCNLNYSA